MTHKLTTKYIRQLIREELDVLKEGKDNKRTVLNLIKGIDKLADKIDDIMSTDSNTGGNEFSRGAHSEWTKLIIHLQNMSKDFKQSLK